jgi:hypothetical protein
MPSACSGLFAERGRIGALTSPNDQASVPSVSKATTEP